MAQPLRDIRTSVEEYLKHSVTSIIGPVIPSVPSTMNPNEIGHFILTASNAGEPEGVPMLNLRFHVQSEPPGRAQFEVPSSSVADVRATSNLDDRVLTPGTAVSEMFVYPPVSTLGIGASIQVGGLIVRGLTLGEVTISSHVHAEPDQGYLFPTTRGNDRTTTFTIT